jgi:hypothetical protein
LSFPSPLPTDTQQTPTPIAATGTTTIRREVVGDEYVTALQDVQQRMRVYTRMRRGDGAVNTSLLAIEKPILGARWDVAGDDDIAEACRDELLSSDHARRGTRPILEQASSTCSGCSSTASPRASRSGRSATTGGALHALTRIRQESVRTIRLDAREQPEVLIQYTNRSTAAGARSRCRSRSSCSRCTRARAPTTPAWR